ncbi:MAG: hypothetical protein ACKO5Q_16785, partial [Microcystaceae cyanobacterium]
MRAVICGYYGQDNGGDEALLVTLLQLLPPGVEAIALSANPAMTSQRYGVKSVGNRDWGKILTVITTDNRPHSHLLERRSRIGSHINPLLG